MEGVLLTPNPSPFREGSMASLLVPNRREKIALYVGEGLCLRDDEIQRLSLTDSGMDVYNSIMSELLQEV